MATITAALVNELRSRTGQGMMECKKALTETGGDIEKAIEWFRKKGVKASVTQRSATEGRIGLAVASDARSGVLVEVLCNTDFTARSEPVQQILQAAATTLLSQPSANLAEDQQIRSMLTAASQQTGENVQLGRWAVLGGDGGKIGGFLYTVTGKIGVLVSVSDNASDELIRNLCLHITATRPLAMDRQGVPADVLAKEREIAIEQAKATGKPQQIAEKIAEGKLAAFFKERVLLDQPFIRPEVFDGSVAELLKRHSVTLHRYVRMEVGQA